MSEQILGFLGLMRRAGALAVGAEDAFDAARENKARVLVMAGDVAKNTVSAMHNAAAQKEEGIPLIKLDCTKRELGTAVGVKECAALAVLDTGFALALCQKLDKADLIPALEQRLEREKKRKAKAEAKAAKAKTPRVKKSPVDSVQYVPRKYTLGERVIMRGDSGHDVLSVAKILVKKLYLDEADIIYTPDGGAVYDGAMVKAILLFQEFNDFYKDGIIGRELIKALRKKK